jgi:long-chain acyl-CoA synthetase
MALGPHNLAALAERAYERHGDRDTVFFEGRWYASGELRERALRLAEGLSGLGVSGGDRVVVSMANCPEVPMTYTALWRAGAVVTPAIFLLPPPELRHILVDSAAVAVVTTPEFLGNVRAAAEGVDTLEHIICLGAGGEGVVSFDELEQAEPAAIVERADDDLAALLYTGGTTGRAKGVQLTHTNLFACAESGYRASHVDGVTRTISALPLAHAYGLVVSVSAQHAEEPGDAILMRWFEPQGWLELASEHRPQRATVVPAMVQLLLTQPLEDYDLSALRYVICGAAPLPPEVATAFEQRVPSAQIHEGYGCTEAGGVISVNPPDARKLGSVGKPLPGYEVAVLDDGGEPVPTGELGEICCRSAGVMVGYRDAAADTEHALHGGWLHTGDIGKLDDDGYIYVVDRKKDLIIRGGFNVFPRDVEDAMVEHPAVSMAGVVGSPDPEVGEEVVAFVSLHPGAEVSPEELVAFGKERLGGYKYPREVRILDQVPLTPIAKIDRKALRALL